MENQSAIPERTKLRFHEYDPQTLNVQDFKPLLIERVLDSGTRDEVRWLFGCYPRNEIIAYLEARGRKHLSRVSANFWFKFFDLPLPPKPKNPLWQD